MSRILRLKMAFALVVLLVFGSVGVYPIAASHYGWPGPVWLQKKKLALGLDLRGGVHLVLGMQIPPNTRSEDRDRIADDTYRTIERRVNELGVAEPNIALQGAARDQILVQLPGMSEIDRAKKIIDATGLLELRLVRSGPAASREALLVADGAADGDVFADAPRTNGEGAVAAAFYLLEKRPIVSGGDIRNARPVLDENNRPAVGFTLSADGGKRFGDATGANIGRSLAVVLDQRVQSVARIDNRITTDGRIMGNFTPEDVQSLCAILRSGSLTVPLTYLAEQTIGASLGADSIRAGVAASMVGLALIVLFMVAYYRLAGVNAVVALLFNLVIVLGLMAYLGGVMTLPGIAGFVLTMGIGVDSNVLIFERIKEEIEAGRTVRAAVDAGFDRVFRTLLDTHVAALISAALLFQFGTGPIRGFAVTLSAGLAANLFTSTFVSRLLFDLTLKLRPRVEWVI